MMRVALGSKSKDKSDHRDEIRQVFKMWRQGYTWEEIATELHDPKPGAVKKRFWRWIKQNFPQKPRQKPLHPGRHMPKRLAHMNGETPEQSGIACNVNTKRECRIRTPTQNGTGPPTDILQDLATRPARHEDIEKDKQWKDVIHCARATRSTLISGGVSARRGS